MATGIAEEECRNSIANKAALKQIDVVAFGYQLLFHPCNPLFPWFKHAVTQNPRQKNDTRQKLTPTRYLDRIKGQTAALYKNK